MALRQKTGLGMMDCKKALIAAGGDAAAAEEPPSARSSRARWTPAPTAPPARAASPSPSTAATPRSSRLRAETDFTARNDSFREHRRTPDRDQGCALGPRRRRHPRRRAHQGARRGPDHHRREHLAWPVAPSSSGGSFATYLHHDSKLGVLLQFEGELPEDRRHRHLPARRRQRPDAHGRRRDTDCRATSSPSRPAKPRPKPRTAASRPEIAAKIAEGKMRKFFEEVTLARPEVRPRRHQADFGSLLPDGTTLKNFVRLQVGGE